MASLFSADRSTNVSEKEITPFQRLKPACVELLAISSNAIYNKDQTERARSCLRRLQTLLKSFLGCSPEWSKASSPADPTPALSPSLIHYVFFPISQIVSASPKGMASLPDSLTESIFHVLKLLAKQWWYSWQASSNSKPKDWGVWRDLVLLGTSVLGDPGKTRQPSASTASSETKLAACSFLEELLSARYVPHPVQAARASDWEWDGISELPSLDDLESLEEKRTIATDPELAFPAKQHLDFVTRDQISKGSLSFCLSATFALADDLEQPTELRVSAIRLARLALFVWIGGVLIPPAGENTQSVGTRRHYLLPVEGIDDSVKVADRLRPLLPGLASSLTRLITSKVKTPSQTRSNRSTPGPVASEAIDLLRDLLCSTLSDASLQSVLNVSHNNLQELPRQNASVINKLEDFAQANDTDLAEGLNHGSASKAPTTPHELQKWTLSSLAQIKLALKSFTSMTMPSDFGLTLPSSTSSDVQRSLIDLAKALIVQCDHAFKWLDQQIGSVSDADTETQTTLQILVLWIIDLSADSNTLLISTYARAALGSLWASSAHTKMSSADIDDLLQVVTSGAFEQLPHGIRKGNDNAVARLSIRLITVFQLISQHGFLTSTRSLSYSTSKFGASHQWHKDLVQALNVESITYREGADEATWSLVPRFASLESSTAQHLAKMLASYGRLMARQSIADMQRVTSLLSSTGPFEMILSFVKQACALRSLRVTPGRSLHQEQSLTSLFVAAELFKGASDSLDNIELGFTSRTAEQTNKIRKMSHTFAKKVFYMVVECLDGDTEEVLLAAADTHSASYIYDGVVAQDTQAIKRGPDLSIVRQEDDDAVVERVKGLSLTSDSASRPLKHGPALDLSYVSAASLSGAGQKTDSGQRGSLDKQYANAQRILEFSDALLFSLIGCCSKILGQAFRPFMRQASYPLMGAMSSVSSRLSEDVLRSAAVATFNQIAYNSAYASPKNCMLDHADYILGGACQRLICGLEEELDVMHGTNGMISTSDNSSTYGQEVAVRGTSRALLPLNSAQRAPFVLVEMIRMLGSEIVPMIQDAIEEILDALDRFHSEQKVADGLLAVLGSILQTMATEQAGSIDFKKHLAEAAICSNKAEHEEMAIMQAWLDEQEKRGAGIEAASRDQAAEDSEETKASSGEKKKTPHVATQILLKAVPFLTHPSSDLRCRVLDLLRHGIETLAPQDCMEDLLPVVNSAWPFVMSRLGQSFSTSNTGSTALPVIIDFKTGAGPLKQANTPNQTTNHWSEQNQAVWIAACRFTASAARYISDFTGRKIVQEAWPRFDKILSLLQSKFDSSSTSSDPDHVWLESVKEKVTQVGRVNDTTKSLVKVAQRTGPYIISSPTSQPAELVVAIVTTLTATITYAGSTLSDDVPWDIATHHILLGLLDVRQALNVQQAAKNLYTSLAKRNRDATWLVLRATFGMGETGGERGTHARPPLPRYFDRPEVRVHAEVFHSILTI